MTRGILHRGKSKGLHEMRLFPSNFLVLTVANEHPMDTTSMNFLKFIYLFIYLSLAALGLCCCARAFSSCGERGLLFVVVPGFLIAVASLVVGHRLQARRLQ